MRGLIDDWRAGFAALAPGHFPYARFLGALLVAGIGGTLFWTLQLPLAWMLGAMTACTLAALLRAPIAAPPIIRPPMSAIIGVMLGAGFAPEILGHLARWLPTILGLGAFIAVSAAACFVYFRRVGGFDPITAYFAGMPGGLVEMVLLGEQKGGDAEAIALVHSARILLIVLSLPFLVEIIVGISLAGTGTTGASLDDTSLTTALLFVVTAIAGLVLGRLLRLPAPQLVGPMLLSAAVHVSGLTDFVPPQEVVSGAQLVLGAVIGCRFLEAAPRRVLRIIALSLGSTVILLTITFAFGWLMSRISGQEALPVILAYSPGGLTEMSLVALALQIEVAFVAAHHIVRVILVMLGANAMYALFERTLGPRP